MAPPLFHFSHIKTRKSFTAKQGGRTVPHNLRKIEVFVDPQVRYSALPCHRVLHRTRFICKHVCISTEEAVHNVENACSSYIKFIFSSFFSTLKIGGGTRYYNDPVSGQKYKTCGNAKGGWKGADHNYAVCCNGNTEGRSGEGNHGYLASTFENPKTTKVGNAKYYWDVRANNRKPLKDCKAGEIVANAKTRKYAFDRTCRACPSGQYTETKNGEACSACPVCAAGTFETKQCSGVSCVVRRCVCVLLA